MSQQASLHLITVTPQSESALPGQGSSAKAEDDLVHRLALWLADVSAEAALTPRAQEANATPRLVAPHSPSVAESPR